MAGHPEDGEPPRRSALEQLPLKQRVLAEQRGYIVRPPGSPDDQADPAISDGPRLGQRIGVLVVIILALGLLVGVIALGASLR